MHRRCWILGRTPAAELSSPGALPARSGCAGSATSKGVWVEGYQPYWHVDVRCRSEPHEPDATYGTKDEWALGYTNWMLCVKRLARAFAFLTEHRGAVTSVAAGLAIPAVAVDDLRRLLQVHHDACAGIPGREEFHALCAEVDDALLAPARTD